MIEFTTRLSKVLLAAIGTVAVANFFIFIAVLTPAWQVAEDTDVGRYVQSGLWLYCPGAAQCWYIFSDNLINYYERVDVCRFLLIGDCRKKLLRTPYFFGWHYAVLALSLVALGFGGAAVCSAALGMLKRPKLRIATIVFDACVFMAFLILAIALTVFVINAEMLESKYLIGVKNTFRKEYGYSFYLAGLALLLLVFSSLAAITLTTLVFFVKDGQHLSTKPTKEFRESQYFDRSQHYPHQDSSMLDGRPQHSPSILRQNMEMRADPLAAELQRSVTPLSTTPSVCGQFIRPQFKNGQFQPTTRHFYSY